MDIDSATDLVRSSLLLILLLSAPVLICGLVVGVIMSLLQAVTQVQEQTLSFIPKILAMFLVAALTLPWMGGHLLEFAREIFTIGLMP
jgi:flagellar biosynthetic protein FliQ